MLTEQMRAAWAEAVRFARMWVTGLVRSGSIGPTVDARAILAVDARLRALEVEHTAAIEVLAADKAKWEDRTSLTELLIRRCEDARRLWRQAVEAVDAEQGQEASR